MPNQTVTINFAQGLNTKSDPWQLPVGQFLALENSVFTIEGQLKKRDGYPEVTTAPSNCSYLTTLNNNLLCIGNTINANVDTLQEFVSKGTLQPCSLSVAPIIRNNLNQTQTDAAVSNGLICVTYTQVNNGTSTYLYAIQDAVTEQNVVLPTALPVLSTGTINGSSRVFVVGSFFVIVSPVLVSATTYLQYISISVLQPTVTSLAQNVYAEAYVAVSGNPGWDGVVTGNDELVVAYNTTAGAQGVHVTVLTAAQISQHLASGVVKTFSNAAYIGAKMSVCVDLTVSPNIIYVTFYNNSNSNVYSCAVYLGLATITTQFNPTVITNALVANLASAAQSGTAHLYIEVTNAYSFDATIPSNYITGSTITSAGVAGTPYTAIRSVGLASKAFIVNSIYYFLGAFQSPYQPSYFLINGTTSVQASPVIVTKLAYQNGGGYLTLGLPSVTIDGLIASISYLYKQNVQSISTLTDTAQTTTGNIYSQLGINLASIEIGTSRVQSQELANVLQLSGGYLSMFDGFYPVEHNFFLFPDSVKCTWTENSVVTPTGTFSSGSISVVVSSATGIYAGMTITDTSNAYIPANTQINKVSGTTLTINKATTGAGTADNLSIQGNIASKPDGSTLTNAYYYSLTYEWSDSKGNAYKSQPSIPVGVTTTGAVTTGTVSVQFPTLRLTQKVTNAVKAVIYRWSVQSQAYNQVTSITAPVLNDLTTDQITFIDTLSDANVIGNNLLYTTGGVVADTNGPATNLVAAFDTRLFLVSAEDGNTLWVSKAVVPNTPVEMSSLFTIYIAPNTGTTQSTGPVTSLFPLDDKLILFKTNSTFYINGTGPDNLGTTSAGCSLGNYSPPNFVTSVVGCTNQNSIVLVPEGLMFQSDKGIWLLNRALGTQYIGAPVEQYNDFTVTSAQVIPETNFVLFTLDTGTILMYDFYYKQWGTWTVPANTGIVSSCIYQGRHTILTDNGLVFQQTPDTSLDGSIPVLISFRTSWLNLASLQGYQRIKDFFLLGKVLSPFKLQTNVSYDYNPSAAHSVLIAPVNYTTAAPSPFGDPTPFGTPFNRFQWRIHAKQQLCQSFQISCQESYDASYGQAPGAGLTLSSIICNIDIKKATRPIQGSNTIG